jgi:hypothetical protein
VAAQVLTDALSPTIAALDTITMTAVSFVAPVPAPMRPRVALVSGRATGVGRGGTGQVSQRA